MDFVNFFLVDPPIHFCKEILNNTVPKIYELDFIKVEWLLQTNLSLANLSELTFISPEIIRKQ